MFDYWRIWLLALSRCWWPRYGPSEGNQDPELYSLKVAFFAEDMGIFQMISTSLDKLGGIEGVSDLRRFRCFFMPAISLKLYLPEHVVSSK